MSRRPSSPPATPPAAEITRTAWDTCRLGDPVLVFNNDGSLWPVPARPGTIVGLGLERGTVHVAVAPHPDMPTLPADKLRGARIFEGELPRFRDDKSIEGNMPAGVFVVMVNQFGEPDRFPALPLGDSGNKRPLRAR